MWLRMACRRLLPVFELVDASRQHVPEDAYESNFDDKEVIVQMILSRDQAQADVAYAENRDKVFAAARWKLWELEPTSRMTAVCECET